MAYLGKKNKGESCHVQGCLEEGYFLKDETVLLCKEHGKSPIDRILEKKTKSPKEKEILKRYLLNCKSILKEVSDVISKRQK